MISPTVDAADETRGLSSDTTNIQWQRQDPSKASYLDLPGELRNAIYAYYFEEKVGFQRPDPWTGPNSYFRRDFAPLIALTTKLRLNKAIYDEARSYLFARCLYLEEFQVIDDFQLFWSFVNMIPEDMYREGPIAFTILREGWYLESGDEADVEAVLGAVAKLFAYDEIMEMMELGSEKVWEDKSYNATKDHVTFRHSSFRSGLYVSTATCFSLSNNTIRYVFKLGCNPLQVEWECKEFSDGSASMCSSFRLISTFDTARKLASIMREVSRASS